MVDSLNYFGAQSPDFPSKFQNHFYSYIFSDPVSLIPTAVASPKTLSGAHQWVPSVGLLNLVAGVPKVLNLFDALTAGRPKFTKFGASVPTALVVKSIRQR